MNFRVRTFKNKKGYRLGVDILSLFPEITEWLEVTHHYRKFNYETSASQNDMVCWVDWVVPTKELAGMLIMRFDGFSVDQSAPLKL